VKYEEKNQGAIKKKNKKKIPLPDNLGSWFSVYNLILTQLDEICRKNYWVPSKKNKKKSNQTPTSK
jgi:Zn/Cd-binding protein ZinT